MTWRGKSTPSCSGDSRKLSRARDSPPGKAAFSTDQLNLLEKINRYGACAQLAEVFETSGIAAAARVAKGFEDGFREMCNKLNARDPDGKPLTQGGDYDYLFDRWPKSKRRARNSAASPAETSTRARLRARIRRTFQEMGPKRILKG